MTDRKHGIDRRRFIGAAALTAGVESRFGRIHLVSANALYPAERDRVRLHRRMAARSTTGRE